MNKAKAKRFLSFAIYHIAQEQANKRHNIAHRPGTTFATCHNPCNCEFAWKVREAAVQTGLITEAEFEHRVAECDAPATPT